MKRLNILVTGGSGFIGSHLVTVLVKADYQVAIIDVKNPKLALNQVEFISQSMADPKLEETIAKLKPEIIFHLAAASSILSQEEEILTSNIAGTYNLLSAVAKIGAKKFIFASSAAVYGPNQKLPISETAVLKPTSAYGLSKLTGELYCHQFAKLQPVILRLANVYGPGQNFSAEGGVVAIFIDKLLSGVPPTIFGDGKQTRDFIFVADIVSAMIKALNSPAGVFNVSSNTSLSINELLAAIQKILGTDLKAYLSAERSGDIRASRLDNDKIKTTFSWQPKVSLVEGLTQTINYFKKQ